MIHLAVCWFLTIFSPHPPVYLSGRKLTSQGTRDLDRIAGQVRIIHLIFVLIVNTSLWNIRIFLWTCLLKGSIRLFFVLFFCQEHKILSFFFFFFQNLKYLSCPVVYLPYCLCLTWFVSNHKPIRAALELNDIFETSSSICWGFP